MRGTRMAKLGALACAIAALALVATGCGDDDDDSANGGGEATVTETETTEEATDQADDEAADQASSGGGGTTAPRAEKVEIVDFEYDPDPVTVAVGGKVTWLNQDSAPHTATAEDESFDTGTLDEGKLGSATFKEAGSFSYICTIHPTMEGTVEVVE
jgi:plastocyanin